jgi:cell division septum initiation protein DivIVA
VKGLSQDALVALDPLREALRTAAREEADGIESRAAEEAAAVLAAAQQRAEKVVADATAHGAAGARAAAALRSARARREANELVLAAQEALRRALVDQVVRAAQGLRGEQRYAEWVDQLTRRCHEALGPLATVTPSTSGGVVGELGSRRLDLSIPVLAAAAVEAHAAEVRTLWTP